MLLEAVSQDSATANAVTIAFLVIALAVYFLPTILAFARRCVSALPILLLNLLLGWTVIGWICALAWALLGHKEFRRREPPAAGPHESEGQIAIDKAISDYVLLNRSAEVPIEDIAKAHSMSVDHVLSAAQNAMSSAVATIMETRFLSEEEADRVSAACTSLGIAAASCPGVDEAIKKSATIRALDAGKLPSVSTKGLDPINLQKGEQLIWVFNGADLFEIRNSVSYVGGSSGFSMRIVKGLYYRTGSYRGHRIEEKQVAKAATGDLCLSNKCLYFVSAQAAVRIPLTKIISVHLFEDGIEIFKDGGKPILFGLSDPGFLATLIGHIERRDA